MNYYKLLNVDAAADPDVVKAAFRALIKKYQSNDRMTRQLIEANEVLGDAAKRRKYDEAAKPKGRVIGNYTLLDKIAEGGFGETWKARHNDLGSLACIKLSLEVTPEDQAFLIEEAKNTWDLRHYGIPAVRDVVVMPDGKVSLVMSYIPGPTLAQIVEKHYPDGMDPEHVAWITERVLNVLKYMHHQGIVHGDIKPQNIIIEPEKHTVVLVDYGLACIRPTKKTEAKGYTPYFCAPEQVDFKPPIPQTDLYGLGMTMIFALGGDVANVRISNTTPPRMRDFIKSLVRLDPLRRPEVWSKVDLCEVIAEVRNEDFGRRASNMKPLVVS